MTSSKPQYPEPGSYEHLDPIELANLHAEYVRSLPREVISDEEAEQVEAKVDGIMALAGFGPEEDPVLKEIGFRHAKGEITGDEARELGRKYIMGE